MALTENQRLEIIQKYQSGTGCTTLGKQYGVHENSIIKLLKTRGIQMRKKLEYSISPEIHAELIEKYHGGMSLEKISEEHNVGRKYITALFKKLNIEIRKIAERTDYTTESWKVAATDVHDGEYGYDRLEYKNSKSKVEILCHDHGYVWQEANSHLKGNRPACCGFSLPHTLEEFKAEAIETHGDDYGYDEVTEIVNRRIEIKIWCKKHQEFFMQRYTFHLNGDGCPKCGIESMSNKRRFAQEDVIEMCTKAHGGFYSYEKLVYEGTENEDRSSARIIVTCREHGDFTPMISSHIKGWGRCKLCNCSGKSRVADDWLTSCGVQNDPQHREVRIHIDEGKYYIVDGYLPESKTVYEFHGSYFHGDPKCFKADVFNKLKGMTHGELYQKTLEKEEILRKSGYDVISMWESEWNETLEEKEKAAKKAA